MHHVFLIQRERKTCVPMTWASASQDNAIMYVVTAPQLKGSHARTEQPWNTRYPVPRVQFLLLGVLHLVVARVLIIGSEL